MADHPFDDEAVEAAAKAYLFAPRLRDGDHGMRAMNAALTAACKSMKERHMAMEAWAVVFDGLNYGTNPPTKIHEPVIHPRNIYQFEDGATQAGDGRQVVPVTIIRHKEQP